MLLGVSSKATIFDKINTFVVLTSFIQLIMLNISNVIKEVNMKKTMKDLFILISGLI